MTIFCQPGTDKQLRPFGRLSLIIICILMAAVGFNLWHLYPELTGGAVPINDTVYHLLLIESAVNALLDGKNVTDHWQGTMSMGFPVFHYYQHLPHVFVAFAHVLTFEVVPLVDLIRWTTYLLLSVFPISIYWSLRRFGFDPLTSAMSGLVAPLIGTDFAGFGAPDFQAYGGLGQTSYIFQGWGLYSQLWAMVVLPLALSVGYQTIRTGRGYFWATLLLSVTLMSHLLYGYMAFLTLATLTFIPILQSTDIKSVASTILMRWKRLIIVLLLVTIITSYFLVPFFLDRQYFNAGVLIKSTVVDSFGHWVVLRALAEGNLFDWGRFPSLTILVFSGIAICILRWKRELYLIPLVIFLFWLLLFFGRSTWGSAIDLLPLSHYLQMHRFVGGVHLGGILISAIALAAYWHWALRHLKIRYVIAATALTLLLLSPLYAERREYLSHNKINVDLSQAALAAEKEELDDLLVTLNKLPSGRVYAGFPQTADGSHWGDQYRVGFTPVYQMLGAEGLDMMTYSFHTYSLPSYVLTEFDEERLGHYNVFNVRYVVAPDYWESPDFVRLLQKFGRHNLYAVDTAGYFDLVKSDLSLAGETADFYYVASGWLSSILPEMKRHPRVYVDGYPSGSDVIHFSESTGVIPYSPVTDRLSFGSVRSEEIGGGYFLADVVVEQESMLLLKATYHPNFEASVNGIKANIVMLMPGFMGIELSPGIHKVYIEYQSGTIRKALLFIAPVALLLILLGERRGYALSAWVSNYIVPRVPGGRKTWTDTRANRRRRKSRG